MTPFLLASLLVAAPQCEQTKLLGREEAGHFGDLVVPAGDADADGVTDLAVRSASLLSEVRILSGATGLELQRLGGTSSDFGHAIAAVGDWDGDGHDDLAVSQPLTNVGGLPGAGRVLLYSGRDGSELLRLDGPQSFGQFGWSLAGVGDVTGDGIVDLAVGEPGNGSNGGQNGAVHLYSGANGALVWSRFGDVRDNLGISLDVAGDVNADGRADVIAGASRDDGGALNAGAAEIYSGPDGSTIAAFRGVFENEGFGAIVAGVGDWDGDGRDDFAVVSPNYPSYGAVHVYSGASLNVLAFLRGTTTSFVGALAGGEDLTGDGTPDLLVGHPASPGSSTFAGAATLYEGGTGRVVRRFVGENALDGLGTSVAALPDLDGDGVGTAALGIPNDDTAATDAGAVLLADCAGFRLDAPAPGIPGASNVLAAREATPDAQVLFLVASQVGTTPLPGACGLDADLLDPRLAGAARADQFGVARVSAFVPASASGRLFAFQAFEPATCRASQSLLHRFP